MKLREFLDRYVSVRKCAGCSALLGYADRDAAFCPACRIKWEMAKTRECSRCGNAAIECECMPKLLSRSGMQTLKKLVLYKPERHGEPENKMLYFLKRHKNKRVAEFAAEQLSHKVLELLHEAGIEKEDLLLVYVPRSKHAAAVHGFDQSKMVLDRVSKICGIESASLFERRKHGKEQKKLTAEARAKNAAKGIFLSKKADISEEKSVIIFDDIVSSGASMARATELLRRKKVRNIFGISIAFND